jgi:hypothetical protein
MSKKKTSESVTTKSKVSNRAKAETLANQKETSKAYKSAMKAFEMTHKRLYPELYNGKSKRA